MKREKHLELLASIRILKIRACYYLEGGQYFDDGKYGVVADYYKAASGYKDAYEKHYFINVKTKSHRH